MMTFTKAKKMIAVLSVSFLLAACGTEEATMDFDTAQDIHLITREDGSGTRGAFIEITGVVDESDDDLIYPGATVQNSTNAVMQTVAGDSTSIGYISIGSLDNSVRGIQVDGVEPTPEAVSAGEYTVKRNFNVVHGEELSEVAQDFWNFFFSAQAQEIVVEQGYVAASAEALEYEPSGLSGDISVVGSTSVDPLMQAFSEAYRKLNADVSINITSPGSGAGITATIGGTADIGMASREIKAEELAELTAGSAIAIDGIAIIVNNDNPIEGLTIDQVKSIYLGETTSWREVTE